MNVDGTLFVKENSFVYRFPLGDIKRNYKTIDFTVTGINNDVENVKEPWKEEKEKEPIKEGKEEPKVIKEYIPWRTRL